MTSSGQLRHLFGEIWAVEGDLKLGPGFYFPVRCTVVRLSDGGLLLHSPVAFSQEAVTAIRELGEVRFLFAPNLFHNKYLGTAHGHFPRAELVGPRGLRQKLERLPIERELGEGDAAPFGPDLRAIFVGGAPTFNEILLHDARSGTLIVGDYFFNVHKTRGFLTRFVLKNVSDAFERPAMSKLWRRATRDRTAMKRAALELLELEVQHIVVCHGEVIQGGREVVRREVAWLLEDE